MKMQIGQKLVKENVVTEGQLQEALARQRLHGGRLGENLQALGYMTEEDLEKIFKPVPPAPTTAEETGLELSFVADLILKHVRHMGVFRLSEVADRVKLPPAVIDQAMEVLRREKLVEVRSASEFVRSSYQFQATDKGKKEGAELAEICSYTGPAPIPLENYRKMIELQTIKNIEVTEESVRRAFSSLVIDDSLLRRLGPAISSGNPMFLYGPPGNGKTTIAETIGRILPSEVFVPYALYVGGQIVNVYDPVTHSAVPDDDSVEDYDRRWIRAKRPVIITGGELTLKSLDLEFNRIAKFYEAPLQLKANNGLFIVDDFGRQQMNPQALLNRWIVNLDRRIDFLSLHTGMKFEIPFDQLVIFATNLEPKSLVDEAFLRRIRYKIKIDHPTAQEYEEIFQRICEANGIPFDKEVFNHLVKDHYHRYGISLSACHPRDIVDHIIDDSRFYKYSPKMTRENVETAWANYFVD